MCIICLLINVSSICPDYFEESLLCRCAMGGESQPCQQTSFLYFTPQNPRYFVVFARFSAIRIVGAARYPVIAGVLLYL